SHAGCANLIVVGQTVRGDEIANVPADLRLERVERNESRDIERDDELPDIARPARGRSEIPDIAAEGRAVERSGQKADDEGKPAALVAAHGEIRALLDPLRIADRRAILAMLHPTLWHRLSFELVGPDRAVRRERGRNIEHHRWLVAGRDRHCD